jgi:hypothetical protein
MPIAPKKYYLFFALVYMFSRTSCGTFFEFTLLNCYLLFTQSNMHCKTRSAHKRIIIHTILYSNSKYTAWQYNIGYQEYNSRKLRRLIVRCHPSSLGSLVAILHTILAMKWTLVDCDGVANPCMKNIHIRLVGHQQQAGME